jgi:diketogulonate reductase-like aldo/keto reductase
LLAAIRRQLNLRRLHHSSMEFKTLGRTGVQLPEIGFGTWNYTGGTEPLRVGVEHGASFIDTAECYGSEEIVGRAVRDCRNRVFLATKVSPRNFRARDLIAAAERSLQRLQTEYIDLYQLHWPNYTVRIEETMWAMEELVNAGKIRFIGASNFSVGELKRAQAALTKYKIVSNQLRYSLVERSIEGGLLKFCQQTEITVIAFSPLGERFSTIQAEDPEGVLALIASRTGRAAPQVALNWLIAKENVIAIPKASTVEHAIEDCAASGWRLAQEDYSLLEKKVRFKHRGRLEAMARRKTKHVLQLFGRQV